MEDGINVIGRLRASNGSTMAALCTMQAFRRQGIPVAMLTHNGIYADRPPETISDVQVVGSLDELPYKTTFILDSCLMLPEFLNFSREQLHDHHLATILYWEIDYMPRSWELPFQGFDTIFTPTAFVEDALARSFQRSGPVAPVVPLHDLSRSRPQRGTRPFTFYCNFDMMSTLQRKNPQGTIDAFITAFGRRDDVQLYVKIWETPGACIDRANVADLHAQFPNIHFIFDHFTYPQVLALIRDCDAYVSMHRAEGLGMGMLEAMSFGLPVIATDYGGNRDFVNAFTALPVPYRLLPVESVQDCYSPESIGVQGYWADPDVAVAAQHMQRLVQDTDLYERLSAAGNACYEKRKNAFLSCDWLGTLDPRRREPSRLRSPQLVGV